MTEFNSIKFAPTTKELSICDASGTSLHSFDLSSTAVKLDIKRTNNGQLKVDMETGNLNNFATDRMELKFKLSGTTHYTSLLFDEPAADIAIEMDNDDVPLSTKGEFAASLIGSDDIRNNRVSVTQLMIMENEITSFGIDGSGMVTMKYHDNINPNV